MNLFHDLISLIILSERKRNVLTKLIFINQCQLCGHSFPFLNAHKQSIYHFAQDKQRAYWFIIHEITSRLFCFLLGIWIKSVSVSLFGHVLML